MMSGLVTTEADCRLLLVPLLKLWHRLSMIGDAMLKVTKVTKHCNAFPSQWTLETLPPSETYVSYEDEYLTVEQDEKEIYSAEFPGHDPCFMSTTEMMEALSEVLDLADCEVIRHAPTGYGPDE